MYRSHFLMDSHSLIGDISRPKFEKVHYDGRLTGASSRPVKNFLICRLQTICAGVTGGSFTHDLPAGNTHTQKKH